MKNSFYEFFLFYFIIFQRIDFPFVRYITKSVNASNLDRSKNTCGMGFKWINYRQTEWKEITLSGWVNSNLIEY